MKTFLIILFVIVAIPSAKAASQTVCDSQNSILPLFVAQDSVQNPKPLVVGDTTQNVTVWAKIAASLGLASLVAGSVGIILGISMGSKLIIAAFVMASYAIITGMVGQRRGGYKNDKWAKKGILFGRISMAGIAAYMTFQLLSVWAKFISFFS